MGKLVKVAGVSELKPGEAKVVETEGLQIALFNVGGRFYATNNICLHRGGPLGEGMLDGETVTCPWHGWQYDVTTGEAKVGSAMKVKTFPVSISGSDVMIEV